MTLDKDTTDLLAKIIPTLLTIVGGAIGWFLKSRLEAKRRAEDALRDQRGKTYVDILMPFAKLFSDLSPKSQQAALRQLTSADYRKLAFQLVLIGSDEVVNAWNEMWNKVYQAEKGTCKNTDVILAFGDVLLAIRRGLGNDTTRLSNKDILRWLIKDADSL